MCETLTLGLMWLGLYDTIREGDGDRILRYWRFFLIAFNHPNYAEEATNLLMQYTYLFSETELLWSRCVNTKGLPARPQYAV
jgi:L1 cell adhesion molecule like protein